MRHPLPLASFTAVLCGTFLAGTCSPAWAADSVSATTSPTTSVTATASPTATAATGVLTVTASDTVTGSAILTFGVEVNSDLSIREQTSNSTGVATFTDLPEGNYSVYSYVSGYLSPSLVPIVIVAGQTTSVNLALTPTSRIEATVVDATTGQPVTQVCLWALESPGGAIPDSSGFCANAQGKIEVDYLAAGTYSLFAQPHDGVHGAQWVGVSGGTGDRDAAARIVVGAGETAQAPTIYLDGAGAITGTVTEATSGAAISGACVATVGLDAYYTRAGYCAGASTDASGQYTLSNLGPYDWPVEFGTDDHAWQWSGGAANRAHATPITATVGGTATSDASLAAGTTITVSVVDSTGESCSDAVAIVVSAETGEAVGDIATDDTMFAQALSQPVRVRYNAGYPVHWWWYQEAADFDSASSIEITDTNIALTLVIPAS